MNAEQSSPVDPARPAPVNTNHCESLEGAGLSQVVENCAQEVSVHWLWA